MQQNQIVNTIPARGTQTSVVQTTAWDCLPCLLASLMMMTMIMATAMTIMKMAMADLTWG